MSIKQVIFFMLLLVFATNVLPNDTGKKIKMGFDLIVSSQETARKIAAEIFMQAPVEFRRQLIKQYKLELNEIVKSLPQKIDEFTTAQSIFMTEKEIIMYYMFHIDKKDIQVDVEKELKDSLKVQAVNQLCSMPRAAVYMLYGNTVTRIYSYQEGEILLEARVSWKDCQSRS